MSSIVLNVTAGLEETRRDREMYSEIRPGDLFNVGVLIAQIFTEQSCVVHNVVSSYSS